MTRARVAGMISWRRTMVPRFLPPFQWRGSRLVRLEPATSRCRSGFGIRQVRISRIEGALPHRHGWEIGKTSTVKRGSRSTSFDTQTCRLYRRNTAHGLGLQAFCTTKPLALCVVVSRNNCSTFTAEPGPPSPPAVHRHATPFRLRDPVCFWTPECLLSSANAVQTANAPFYQDTAVMKNCYFTKEGPMMLIVPREFYNLSIIPTSTSSSGTVTSILRFCSRTRSSQFQVMGGQTSVIADRLFTTVGNSSFWNHLLPNDFTITHHSFSNVERLPFNAVNRTRPDHT